MSIEQIQERLNKATPRPWKRSYFIDKYPHMSPEEKERCRQQEHLTIRGPGQIGLSSCNQVCVFTRAAEADIDFIAHAKEDISFLLAEIEAKDRQIVELTAEVEGYRKAAAEGRMPTVSIGQKVYAWDTVKEIVREGIVSQTKCSERFDSEFIARFEISKHYMSYTWGREEIGKTVFLTREEAEKGGVDGGQ